jgi:hypothetical protein
MVLNNLTKLMKMYLKFMLVGLISICGILHGQVKTRSESYFGIHFDFHATENNREIGKTLTAAMIDSFLTIVQPDYVQVDCKGHPGYSSYPTRVGNQAGGYTQDILRLWREETTKQNVGLYVHYSGLWDGKAMSDHPEWAMLNADGRPDHEKAAYFGKYPDQLLIPQLKEISDYGVDGAWVDGECWATKLDYSPELIEQFTRETGIAQVPEDAESPDYKAFVEFNRKAFKRYMGKYIDAIHAYNPHFQITSNWAYSSMMPEPVENNVDYLSGDVAGQNCVYNAAFQARCMALQGKPWDLMSWGFTYDFEVRMGGPKSLVQLQQEAAHVLAMGGGYQCYWTQNGDGSIKPNHFQLMGELARFCRERESYCKDAKVIPQIGLWYSTYSMRNRTNQVYGWNASHLEGILSLLLDGQNSVEILMDHQLNNAMEQYPLIIIPEWTDLDPELKRKLLEYVNSGGNLLVIGASAVRGFQPQLGVKFEEERVEKNLYIGLDLSLAAIRTMVQPFLPGPGTRTIGNVYTKDDTRFTAGYPFATISSLGKGQVGAVYMNLGDAYYKYQASGYVKLINEIIKELFDHPVARITGSDYVHTVVSQKGSNWYIHLINSAGNHFNSKVYEYNSIPQTGELVVELRTPKPVENATLQPEGLALQTTVKNGITCITVPSVSVHSIVQLGF